MNEKNNGTNNTTNKPNMLLRNSQKTVLKPVHLSSDKPHIIRHLFPMKRWCTWHILGLYMDIPGIGMKGMLCPQEPLRGL